MNLNLILNVHSLHDILTNKKVLICIQEENVSSGQERGRLLHTKEEENKKDLLDAGCGNFGCVCVCVYERKILIG